MWAIAPPLSAELLANTATSSTDPHKHPNSNFWKLCSWSPDGTCVLGLQNDERAHLFSLPSEVAATLGSSQKLTSPHTLEPSLSVLLGECVYDVQWYPACNFLVPQSACFADTGRGRPVVLWDACSGTSRCTYRTYDHADEVTACRSIFFHPDGERYASLHRACSTCGALAFKLNRLLPECFQLILLPGWYELVARADCWAG
jgi:WD40 repeat protein